MLSRVGLSMHGMVRSRGWHASRRTTVCGVYTPRPSPYVIFYVIVDVGRVLMIVMTIIV
jgi:hypothetical protein